MTKDFAPHAGNVRAFSTPKAWGAWLRKHHAGSPGIWIRMQPSGKAQVAAAKADGRWEQAYDSPSASQVPADFLEALVAHRKAAAFFKTLNRANLYAISYRLQTAKKPETRARRFEQILQMMKEGKKFH